MSLIEIRFPHIDGSSRELQAGLILNKSFIGKGQGRLNVESGDLDKNIAPPGIAIFPGWGVQMSALEPLGREFQRLTGQNVLVVREDYEINRPSDYAENRKYHGQIVASVMQILDPEKSLAIPYSKACVSVTDGMSYFESQSVDKNVSKVAYLQGPFFLNRPTPNQLTARFLKEGISDSLSPGNWVGLFRYSSELAQSMWKPRIMLNALADVGLIAEGVNINLIPKDSMAFQSIDDTLFPYREALALWTKLGRGADLVPLKLGESRRGHLYPMVEPIFTANIVLDRVRRRFGEDAI